MLLPRVAKRIDDLEWENFHIPVLQHQSRVIVQNDHDGGDGGAYEYEEDDYVDAQPEFEYDASHFVLSEIQTQAEVRTLQSINKMFERILNRKSVGLAQLRKVLSAEHYKEYLTSLTTPQHFVEITYADGMPDLLKEYNRRLNIADLHYNRYEKLSGTNRGTATSRRKVYERSEKLYENALEYLQECFDCAERGDFGNEMRGQLYSWFDRDVDFDKGFNRTIGIDAVSIPRVKGSKSHQALDSGLPKLSKRLKREECMLRALIVACCDIAFVIPYAIPKVVSTATMKDRLAQLKRNLHPERD